MEGFIKLWRSLLEWEWYDDKNVRLVFIHCLLKANFKDKSWRGQVIKRGSFISSLGGLSSEIGISVQQLRTALEKLKKTGELEVVGQGNNTLIKVFNYNEYQGDTSNRDSSTNKQVTNHQQTNNTQATSLQQTNNKQITTTKERKKERKEEGKKRKKDKKEPLSPFSNSSEIQEKENSKLDDKNESSESKKVPRKKVLSTAQEESIPEIPQMEGFNPPPRPWYQNRLDELVNENGFSPKGTWENALSSKKIEHWSDQLKIEFLDWVFHFASSSTWAVQATVIGKQQNEFNEFLKANSEQDLIQAWQRCQLDNWKSWKTGLKRNREDEQKANNTTKQGGDDKAGSQYGKLGQSVLSEFNQQTNGTQNY